MCTSGGRSAVQPIWVIRRTISDRSGQSVAIWWVCDGPSERSNNDAISARRFRLLFPSGDTEGAARKESSPALARLPALEAFPLEGLRKTNRSSIYEIIMTHGDLNFLVFPRQISQRQAVLSFPSQSVEFGVLLLLVEINKS